MYQRSGSRNDTASKDTAFQGKIRASLMENKPHTIWWKTGPIGPSIVRS
jgi:hypothetical protein